MLDILWLGRGGQGAFTAARLLGLGAVRFADLEAMAFPSFGPERRGAPVYAYTRLSRSPIRDRSPVRQALVAV
ncbi:2-oxoacid:acceptor oxidoreductase family protein, partial [Escherichia coli]